ncbi:hypothetical protein RCH09_001874 [Actimicrobium sp. GrIS 1.19]|uniref:hypothetical protein n=1 Tax=Actimicrobium sp. GrIS 1.19 TaxID=3071708 RepID=UPI002DF9B889|nr:hypothetical protein [Actimicrobium sp. GrIS 1.19]
MVTTQYSSSAEYQEHGYDSAGAVLRRSLFSAVRWGAILAGVAAGVSVQIMLTLLGIATGLAIMDLGNGISATGPVLWAGLCLLVATVVGGYVAARMSGLKRRVDGVLHGIVSWAVTILLFALLAASIGGGIVSGVFTLAPTLMQSARPGAPLAGMLGGQAGRVDATVLQSLEQDIQAGRREPAITALTRAMGMDQDRAAMLVDQALIVAGHPESAAPGARTAAEEAVRRTGYAAWMVFAAVTLAMVGGVLGGWMGVAGSARRTLHGTRGRVGGIPASA